MSLKNVSTDDLEAARADLDHQIRALKERKAEVAREIERRLPNEEPESRVVSQVVAPAFVESESEIPSLDEPVPRRRWWKS